MLPNVGAKKPRRFSTLIRSARPTSLEQLSRSALLPPPISIDNDKRQENDAVKQANVTMESLALDGQSSSTGFSKRSIALGSSAVLVGRANGVRHRAREDNAFFDCRVMSRSHALLWYQQKEGHFFIKVGTRRWLLPKLRIKQHFIFVGP